MSEEDEVGSNDETIDGGLELKAFVEVTVTTMMNQSRNQYFFSMQNLT